MEMILVGVAWDGYLDYIFILGKLMEEHNANQAEVIDKSIKHVSGSKRRSIQ